MERADRRNPTMLITRTSCVPHRRTPWEGCRLVRGLHPAQAAHSIALVKPPLRSCSEGGVPPFPTAPPQRMRRRRGLGIASRAVFHHLAVGPIVLGQRSSRSSPQSPFRHPRQPKWWPLVVAVSWQSITASIPTKHRALLPAHWGAEDQPAPRHCTPPAPRTSFTLPFSHKKRCQRRPRRRR